MTEEYRDNLLYQIDKIDEMLFSLHNWIEDNPDIKDDIVTKHCEELSKVRSLLSELEQDIRHLNCSRNF